MTRCSKAPVDRAEGLFCVFAEETGHEQFFVKGAFTGAGCLQDTFSLCWNVARWRPASRVPPTKQAEVDGS